MAVYIQNTKRFSVTCVDNIHTYCATQKHRYKFVVIPLGSIRLVASMTLSSIPGKDCGNSISLLFDENCQNSNAIYEDFINKVCETKVKAF